MASILLADFAIVLSQNGDIRYVRNSAHLRRAYVRSRPESDAPVINLHSRIRSFVQPDNFRLFISAGDFGAEQSEADLGKRVNLTAASAVRRA